MNKFSRILHNEIANSFKVHQDANHFEVYVRYFISNGLKYDFSKLYSELIDVTYSFKEILRAIKKSNTNRQIDDNYKNAIQSLIKGNSKGIIGHDESTINVLKDLYDLIIPLENSDALEILKFARSYEEDIDSIKSFLVGYLKDESHPSLDFRLLQKVYSQFNENHPERFKSFFSKVQELADAMSADDIAHVSYRAANDKEPVLTKEVIDLFNLNKENIVAIVNDLKNIKGESFQELYDSLTNKISNKDVEDVVDLLSYYLKKAPALRVLNRFSLPSIANRFDAIEDKQFDKFKKNVKEVLGENVKKELVFEMNGGVFYQVNAEYDSSFVEIEKVYDDLKELSNDKHVLTNFNATLIISADECAKITPSTIGFLMYVHAGDPEKAIEYYHSHKNDENDLKNVANILDKFYEGIETEDDELKVVLFTNTEDIEKEKIAANLLFYTISLAKNGFDPGNNEIVKQYGELSDNSEPDEIDFESIMESKNFETTLEEYSSKDYETEVNYFSKAFMTSFSKYLKFPSDDLYSNFNLFANKVMNNEDQPEFMKKVIEDLSATQISNMILNYDRFVAFYPDFKKYMLIFIMSAMRRNFSVKEVVQKFSDDPSEFAKLENYIKKAAPADKVEHFLMLAGLAVKDS